MALLGRQYDGTDDRKDPLVNFHGPDYLNSTMIKCDKIHKT